MPLFIEVFSNFSKLQVLIWGNKYKCIFRQALYYTSSSIVLIIKDYKSGDDEIDRLRERKQNVLVENAEWEGMKQRIQKMREFLEQQSTEVTEYDGLLVRRLIEKITVYDEQFEVEFKSGLKVNVAR